jgi:hypothetical protein
MIYSINQYIIKSINTKFTQSTSIYIIQLINQYIIYSTNTSFTQSINTSFNLQSMKINNSIINQSGNSSVLNTRIQTVNRQIDGSISQL